MQKSQQQKVLVRLVTMGRISGAQAKQMKIKRLSSLIHRLRNSGVEIDLVRRSDGTTFYEYKGLK